MTLDTWINDNQKFLTNTGIDTARLDTIVLLSDELERDKSWVLAHPEHTLQAEQLERLNTKIAQRAKHVPLAYIRGHAEFYGHDFMVNEHVLVPRPESESIIEALQRFAGKMDDSVIVDVGTGSGCLAITAKIAFPTVEVFATDSSASALTVARHNARAFDVDITFKEGDLLTPVIDKTVGKKTVYILANLPYVPTDYPINIAASHEPKIALFGGDDGLAIYKRLFSQVIKNTTANFIIITESLIEQHDALASIAQKVGFSLGDTAGLVQVFARTS